MLTPREYLERADKLLSIAEDRAVGMAGSAERATAYALCAIAAAVVHEIELEDG